MIGAALGIINTKAGRIIAAGVVAVALVVAYGAFREREGAEQARQDYEQQDEQRAQDVRDRAADARDRDADDDRSPDERLRDQGRLRD